MFLRRVESLRSLVQKEIAKFGYPWPENLFLSLIQYESGGKVGRVNTKSGASGLTQVMPIALREYNNKTGDTVRMAELKGTSDQNAETQIKVGAWTLGHFWRLAYAWLMRKNKGKEIDLQDLIRFAFAFYVAGPARIKGLCKGSGPITWDTWSARYPKSRITKYSNHVLGVAQKEGLEWDLEAVDAWVTSHDGDPILPDRPPLYGLLLAAAVICIALYFVLKSDKKKLQEVTQ